MLASVSETTMVLLAVLVVDTLPDPPTVNPPVPVSTMADAAPRELVRLPLIEIECPPVTVKVMSLLVDTVVPEAMVVSALAVVVTAPEAPGLRAIVLVPEVWNVKP